MEPLADLADAPKRFWAMCTYRCDLGTHLRYQCCSGPIPSSARYKQERASWSAAYNFQNPAKDIRIYSLSVPIGRHMNGNMYSSVAFISGHDCGEQNSVIEP